MENELGPSFGPISGDSGKERTARDRFRDRDSSDLMNILNARGQWARGHDPAVGAQGGARDLRNVLKAM